jgi:hypothetical protein
VKERPHLANLLWNEWGALASPVLIHLCSRSIGYEADSHRDDLFSGAETETYFLDYKRTDAHHWVDNAAFPIFRDRLADPNLAQSPIRALARLQEQSHVWADQADPGGRDTTREVYWAIRLLDRLAQPDAQAPAAWAAAVVGALHVTTCDDQTIAWLLQDAGRAFHVRYIDWVPKAQHQPILG